MVLGHKIKKKVKVSKFLEQIQEYKKDDIETTNHTFFHLNEKQRKIYGESWLKELLFNETPLLAGVQYNNLWTLFYKYKKDIWRIIVDIQIDKIYIVTFYKIDIEQIPKI